VSTPIEQLTQAARALEKLWTSLETGLLTMTQGQDTALDVLCCAVLCCAVLFCAVLCCAVLQSMVQH